MSPPRDNIEKELVRIWSGVLGLEEDRIGIDDSFFELGGHSLKAALLINRAYKELDVQVPLTEIFTSPTIRELARYMKEGVKDKYTAIEPIEKKEYYALSSAQRRLYIMYKLDEQSRGYNIPLVLTLEGGLDKEKLAGTFRGLIRRHESLRTSFIMVKDEPVQRIHDRVEFEVEYFLIEEDPERKNYILQNTNYKSIRNSQFQSSNHEVPFGQILDASGENSGKEGDKAHSFPKILELSAKSYIENFIRPFDLSKAPLLRVGLIHSPSLAGHPSPGGIPGDTYILMVDMHHIISDGTSNGILMEDFISLYRGEDLVPLRVQYKDYSQWRNSEVQIKSIKEQEAYWLEEYQGKIPRLNIPTDYARPAVQSFEGSVVNFDLGKEETARLREIAKEEGVTLFMVLVSIYSIFLSKISGQEDIIIGTSISGRGHGDLEKIMGMFVNALALRNHIEGDKTFREILWKVMRKALQAFENRDYPFEELVEKVGGMKDMSRNPIFDVRFTFNNLEITERELPGLKARPGVSEDIYQTSKFDLTLAGWEVEDRLDFSFEYCVKLFKETRINQYVDYIKEIVSIVIKNPGICLKDIKISHEFKTIKSRAHQIDLEF